MKNKLAMSILIILMSIPLFSQCTIFSASDENKILVGNNEDYGPALKRIWINPPETGKYGTVLFGFDTGYNNYEGGVNDQGLFIDAAAIPTTGWVSDPKKKVLKVEDFFEVLLKRCKDLNDIRGYVDTYNIPILNRAQFMIVDKNGQSAVLLWHENTQKLVIKDKIFQLVTNFHYLNGDNNYHPCLRYIIGEKMLKNSKNFSIEGFKKILFATHDYRGGNPSSYSTIFDLKNMKVYIYNFYNFFNQYVIDLKKIFIQGKSVIKFSDIFDEFSFVEVNHYAAKLIDHLSHLLKKKGVKEVFDVIRKLEKKYSVMNGLSGRDLNSLGYRLINDKMIAKAIEVFHYNIQKCPQNANVYDSLAEAYLVNNDKKNAVKYYKEALRIQPKLKSAKDALKKLVTD